MKANKQNSTNKSEKVQVSISEPLIDNETTYGELLQILGNQPKLMSRPGSVSISIESF